MFDKKILCLGNETESTDFMVSELANANQTINHGLITDKNFLAKEFGYYHTSVVDLAEGDIINLASQFDCIKLVDQDQDDYPHWKTLVKTFRLLKVLDGQGTVVDYLNNNNIKRHEFWWNYLRTNQSFCFHPFIALVPDLEKTVICSKSSYPIKYPREITNWQTDPDYTHLRNLMFEGKELPDSYCQDCNDRQKRGLESARQFETFEWAVRLKLDSPEDFKKFTDPILYEIRPSNKCNIMCRMCDEVRSHLIEKEKKELSWPLLPWRYHDLSFDQINFETVERIYVAGGEPTIMPEFYNLLQKCIDIGRTDFELCVGTNGMKFSNKLLNLLSKFNNVVFSVSFDGYKLVNDYIRWKSDFDTIVKNSKIAKAQGIKIGLQTVISMYNVTRVHEIFEFYDNEFPGSASLVQAAAGNGNGFNCGDGNILLPWNHPRADLVVKSMERCKKTNQYYINGRSC
jgi:organic radical activating enzyme